MRALVSAAICFSSPRTNRPSRTTVQSPLRWGTSHDWKSDYSNIAKVSAEEVARLRAENDVAKATAKALREQQAAG